MTPLFPAPPPPPPMRRDPDRAMLVRRPLEERLLTTVRDLSEAVAIRLPGSLGEADAAGYIAGRLNVANQQATVLPIPTERGTPFGTSVPILVAALASVAAVIVAQPVTTIIALVMLVVVPFAIWNEVEGHALLGALHGRQQSQSVIGVRAPVGKRQRTRVVIIAPLDRIPAAPARRLLLFALQLILVQALLFIAWLAAEQALLRGALALGCIALVAVAVSILRMRQRANLRPAIQGAGDLAVLVAVAEELGELQHVELWTAALGAVSVGDSGIRELLKHYPFEPDTLFVNLHDLTAGQPAYVTREGILREHRSDRTLLALASGADAADVSINAEPRQLRQRTLAALPLRLGYPTLSITSHTDGQRFASVDTRSLERCVKLVVGIIRELDRIA